MTLVILGFTITVGHLSLHKESNTLTYTNIHTETDYDPKGYKYKHPHSEAQTNYDPKVTYKRLKRCPIGLHKHANTRLSFQHAAE